MKMDKEKQTKIDKEQTKMPFREPCPPISDRSALQDRGSLTEDQWRKFYAESEELLQSEETVNTLITVVKVTNDVEGSSLVLGEMLCEIFESMGVEGSFGMELLHDFKKTLPGFVQESDTTKSSEFMQMHRKFGESFGSLCDAIGLNSISPPGDGIAGGYEVGSHLPRTCVPCHDTAKKRI